MAKLMAEKVQKESDREVVIPRSGSQMFTCLYLYCKQHDERLTHSYTVSTSTTAHTGSMNSMRSFEQTLSCAL